jgi:ATP-citrate lyase beta-subunit
VPRKKLSEFRAKSIINQALGIDYRGYSVDIDSKVPQQLEGFGAGSFAIKVDQGVKGRLKKGLVMLGIEQEELAAAVGQLSDKGYRWLLVEPMVAHEDSKERYLSLSRDRGGLHMAFSAVGGVDVESHFDRMQTELITDHTDWPSLSARTGMAEAQLRQLVMMFEQEYMVFLEINPYVVVAGEMYILDLAVEVDDAGAYFADSWGEADFRDPSSRTLTEQEQIVHALNKKSPASLKLDVINPEGTIFLLLSGGGASIAVADEIHAKGYGSRLANYGEYSGNPTAEETYIYALAVLELLLASNAHNKVLFIGGAVANFTDIARTFDGIIQALEKVAMQLREQQVKIFVRRGGPRQEVGLTKIQAVLTQYGLLGAVHDPETELSKAIAEMLKEAA